MRRRGRVMTVVMIAVIVLAWWGFLRWQQQSIDDAIGVAPVVATQVA